MPANSRIGSIPAIHDAVRRALEEHRNDLRDAYALSFFINDEEDDPRLPTLTVGHNTPEQWRSSVARASSNEEAKWNYAFWLQNKLVCFGRGGTASAEVVARWVSELGLAYSDEDEEADFDRCMELGAQITSHFVAAVCDIALALHEDGAILATFGRPVPVIVHELEYYDEIADQTERCNPPGVAHEFVSWVRNGCS